MPPHKLSEYINTHLSPSLSLAVMQAQSDQKSVIVSNKTIQQTDNTVSPESHKCNIAAHDVWKSSGFVIVHR